MTNLPVGLENQEGQAADIVSRGIEQYFELRSLGIPALENGTGDWMVAAARRAEEEAEKAEQCGDLMWRQLITKIILSAMTQDDPEKLQEQLFRSLAHLWMWIEQLDNEISSLGS
jgi:hypothetical protein